MLIPSFIISLLKWIGVSTAEKVIDDAVDSALNHKDNKKSRDQLKDIQETTHNIDTLLNRLVNDSSETIRNAAAELKPLIETLHVTTAHEVLDGLRAKVRAEDRSTLSRIDYYRACCSRYINRDQCISEYNLAYQEMIDASCYDPEIVAGKICVNCFNKDKQAAILAANHLKEICRTNIWAWVPDLLFSDNLDTAYDSLPLDIDRLLVLANSCMLGNNKESLGVDIHSYKVSFPDNLTYDNIPIWSYNLSVLLNLFIPEWIENAAKEKAGESTKMLFKATGKLRELEKRTQLNGTFGDLDFWYAISGCQISPTDELMETLRTANCQKEYEEYRVVAYVVCLANMGEENNEKAKAYLNSAIITPATLNQRFLLSLKTMDSDYADDTFQMAATTRVVFPSQLIIYALSAIKNFKCRVKQYAPQLLVQNELDAKAYEQICNHFFDVDVNVSLIFEIMDKVARPFQPFLAVVLYECKHIEEGLSLMRSVVPDDHVELVSHMYADLLARNRCHTEEYYKFLHHVRLDLGFTDNPAWLQNEYNIASQLPDIECMVATSGILHNRYPEQKSFYIAYLYSLARENDHLRIADLSKQLNNYDYSPSEAVFVYRQLVFGNQFAIAVEFLYHQVIKNPTDEGLNMEFHRASMVAATAKIINEEYDEVFDGAYVQYKLNEEQKCTIIDAKNRDGFLIGLKKGESTEQKDWRGKPETYEVVGIYNKYHQLIERIYQDIGDNKFNSIHSFQFSDEEMQGGNVITLLQDITGHNSDWQKQQRERELKYKKGEYPFSIFLNEGSLLDDVYNHIFGDFKYYNFPQKQFALLYDQEGVSITDFKPVFDIPSIILAFELQLKFNLSFSNFIVPDSLVKVIECSIQCEQFNISAGVYKMVTDSLASIESLDGDCWSVTRFKALIAWIKENAEIIQVTERLNHDHDKLFKESSYLTVFYDCLSLVKGKRVLVSGDKSLVSIFVNRFPVTDVDYLFSVLFPAQYPLICQFFMQCNIYGGALDSEYMLAEYVKHSNGSESTFCQCKENLLYNKYLFQVAFDVCKGIMEAPIINSADELIVMDLLSETFSSVNRDAAILMLNSFTIQTRSMHFKGVLVNAFKAVYPLS